MSQSYQCKVILTLAVGNKGVVLDNITLYLFMCEQLMYASFQNNIVHLNCQTLSTLL